MIERALTLGYKGTVVYTCCTYRIQTAGQPHVATITVLCVRCHCVPTTPRRLACRSQTHTLRFSLTRNCRPHCTWWTLSHSSHPTQCVSSPVVIVELDPFSPPHTPATPLIIINPYFLKRFLTLLAAQETHWHREFCAISNKGPPARRSLYNSFSSQNMFSFMSTLLFVYSMPSEMNKNLKNN